MQDFKISFGGEGGTQWPLVSDLGLNDALPVISTVIWISSLIISC